MTNVRAATPPSFQRRIRYDRDVQALLIIRWNPGIIGACLDQFPPDVVAITKDRDFTHPFEYEAMMTAGQQSRELHGFVVDDLRCYHAIEYMEAESPNDEQTLRARHAFPHHSADLLDSPFLNALLDVARQGDLGIYQEPEAEDEEEQQL